jgi:two-component system chemotaxis response regulator CheB
VQGLRQRLQDERETAQRASAVATAGASDGLLIIGVSTGGPRALEQVLPALPANFPWPVLVAQHMPASFTGPFAARLNSLCALEVVEVTRPMAAQRGTVYIGKGGADMVVTRRGNVLTVLPKPESPEFLWHPSVELLARSALEHVKGHHIVGVMLTGMGYDGADGFTAIKKAGGRTIAESEETAVVFGMPAVLIEKGGASLVVPLDKVAAQVKAWANR